jgi:prepilin-type N-terminal cleavage/methylation domain-containing protein
MKKYKNKLKALTLIELITVIAIIAVITSISAGFIKFYQPVIQLHTNARALKSNVEQARARTVAEQKSYGIVVDDIHNTYTLVLLSGGTTVVASYQLSDEISIASISSFSNNTIRFNTAGAALESGTIALQNSRGEQRTITINPSGYVQTD